MARRDLPLRGLLLADTRITPATLSSTDASYTEAGPHPGTPVADVPGSGLALRLSGEQSDELVFQVQAAGSPPRVAYRVGSETSVSARGWQPPNMIMAWRSAEFDSTTSFGPAHDATVIPSTQKIVALYFQSASPYAIRTRRYDPFTSTWSSAVDLPVVASTAAVRCGGIACLPGSERLVAVVCSDANLWQTYISDDDGASWTLGASDVLVEIPSLTTPTRGRLFATPSGDLLLGLCESGILQQYASSSLGASFSRVVNWASAGAATPDVVALSGGKFGVVCRRTADDFPTIRIVGSPYEDLSLATEQEIAGSAVGEIAAWTDAGGKIYVAARYIQTWRLYTSSDDGDTWVQPTHYAFDTLDAGTYPTAITALCAMGSAFWLHQWVASPGDEDLGIAIMQLGGWSSFVTGTDTNSTVADADGRRLGFGSSSSYLTIRALQWVPFDTAPDIVSWTAAGTGSEALIAGGLMEITTTGAQSRNYEVATIPASPSSILLVAALTVVSGGSLSSGYIALRADLNNGATDYAIQVNFTTTGFRVEDVLAGPTTLATVTIDCTTEIVVAVLLDNAGRGEVLYRRPGSAAWTSASDSTLTAGTIATRALWGHFSTSTSVSRWSHVQVLTGALSGRQWHSSASGASTHQNVLGRLLSGTPYPLGDSADAGATWVAAVDGPGLIAETATSTPAYDYPIEAVHPLTSPSPRATWRSTVTTETILAWAPGGGIATGLGGRSWGLALLGVNFPTAYLEAWTGAAWVALGTWSGVVASGLTYTRTGDVIRINGGSAIARYIWRNELVGATVSLGSSKYRKITRHTEGIWSSAAGRHVELILEGIDGTEPGSGSALAIWAHSGALVLHGIDALYSKFRLRLPSQANADGYHEIGTCLLGQVVAFGQEWEWGKQSSRAPNAETTVSASGVSRVRRKGPAPRSWSVAWSGGVEQSQLRDASPEPDFLAYGAVSEGIASIGDVPFLLEGLIEETESGAVPVVVLAEIPAASGTTITDPTLFLYSRLVSPVSHEQILGNEGSDELLRGGQITFEEIP